jgi:DNA repair protein RadA/Sms
MSPWRGGVPHVGAGGTQLAALDLTEVDPTAAAVVPTGQPELDRVLAGGLVPGSVTLLGGAPGIGKSTLALQVALSVAARGSRVLLVAAEESSTQLRRRADRLGLPLNGCFVVVTTQLSAVAEAMAMLAPELVVVDSIQTIADQALPGSAGSVSQVREVAAALAGHARTAQTTMLFVGHVTKDGSLAGPRTLEHLVDTVLELEGDRHHSLRLLSSVKHRFGPAGELGIFDMTPTGLVGVTNASGRLLADRRPRVPGSIVTPALEGNKVLLVEVQALVATSSMATPRRSAEGCSPGRLALMLAVLERRCGVDLSSNDVFAAVAGGIRVREPAADLALGLALASAASGQPFGDDLVACAEVGLAGELRQPRQPAKRLAEAAQLGFRRAIVPSSTPDLGHGLELVRVATLAEAIAHVGRRVSRRVTETETETETEEPPG